MSGFHCRTCGEYHDSLPLAFGADAPHAWAVTRPEALGEDSELSSDQCVLHGKYFFVRGCLDLPIHGTVEAFRWIVWVNVSEADFERISELWEQSGRETQPPYTGWLDSALPGYPETLGLEIELQTQPVGERPQVRVKRVNHPLWIEQSGGLSVEQVQARVEQLMHGSRAA